MLRFDIKKLVVALLSENLLESYKKFLGVSFWLPIGQNASFWLKIGKNASFWLKIGKNASIWLKIGKNASFWLKIGKNASFWLKIGKKCVVLIKNRQKCVVLIKKWSTPRIVLIENFPPQSKRYEETLSKWSKMTIF